MTTLAPVTPGELLAEEFLGPLGNSQYRLAKEIDVPAQRISEIVSGKRSITADTDLRLCRFFGLSDGYWLRALISDGGHWSRRLGGVICRAPLSPEGPSGWLRQPPWSEFRGPFAQAGRWSRSGLPVQLA